MNKNIALDANLFKRLKIKLFLVTWFIFSLLDAINTFANFFVEMSKSFLVLHILNCLLLMWMQISFPENVKNLLG